jgi:hypothetical protein
MLGAIQAVCVVAAIVNNWEMSSAKSDTVAKAHCVSAIIYMAMAIVLEVMKRCL